MSVSYEWSQDHTSTYRLLVYTCTKTDHTQTHTYLGKHTDYLSMYETMMKLILRQRTQTRPREVTGKGLINKLLAGYKLLTPQIIIISLWVFFPCPLHALPLQSVMLLFNSSIGISMAA